MIRTDLATTVAYDSRRSALFSITDAMGRETVFSYNEQGQETSRTLPIGVSTSGDPDDFIERKYYDEDGRLDYEISFEGVVTSYLYDNRAGSSGRLTEKHFFTNLTQYNGGAGTPSEIVVYEYDSFGRLSEVLQDSDADLETEDDQRVVENIFDADGQLVTVVSPEGVIHYEFDAVSGLHTTTWTADDLETAEEESTTHTVYSYDPLGRLDSVTLDRRNGEAVDIDPNTTGNQAEVTDYVFDLLGNLKQERLSNGVVSDYTFDDLNRLETLKQFNDTDRDGVLESGENLLAEYDYDLLADGKRSGVTETDDADNVTTIDWVYDNIGRLTRETYNGPGTDLDFIADYTYDLVGNRLTKKTDTDPTFSGNPTYNETVDYVYDANDRLLLEKLDSNADQTIDQTTAYAYGANADLSTPSALYAGDGTQQTVKTVWSGTDTDPQTGTKRSETTYSYNLQARMSKTEVDSDGNGDLEERYEYSYDDDGIRVSQTVTTDANNNGSLADETAVTTKYLNDKQNPTGYSQVLEEKVAGVVIKTYTVGLTVISQQGSAIAGGGAVFLLKDGHGSTRMLVDANGQIINSGGLQIFAYDAFGNRLDAVANPLTSLLYSGEQTDATGLQYLRARYYDPNTGRFSRLDPFLGRMNEPLTLHKYLYTPGDPINFGDPLGREFTVAGLVNNMQVMLNLTIRVMNVAQKVYRAADAVQTVCNVFGYLQSIARFVTAFSQATASGTSVFEAFVVALSNEYHLSRSNFLEFGTAMNQAFDFIESRWHDLQTRILRKAETIAWDVAHDPEMIATILSHAGKGVGLVLNLPSPPKTIPNIPWSGIPRIEFNIAGYRLILRSDERQGRLFGIEWTPNKKDNYNIVRIDYQDFQSSSFLYSPHYQVGNKQIHEPL